MTRTETPIESLRGYLRQLSPQTRSKLLAEIERMRSSGEDLPGADIILAELRTDILPEAQAKPTFERLEPAARTFFKPVEPYLTDRLPERAGPGQIALTSLFPIWDWLCRDLMASLARGYVSDLKSLTTANKQREAEMAVQAFQNKTIKYLEGTLASPHGAEQARARLTGRAGSKAVFNDVGKILRVLKASEVLAQFAEGLPARIDKLAGARLEKTVALLDKVAAARPDAIPFALTAVASRLKVYWQLIRLATKAATTKDAAEIAATPYAMAVPMVLDQIEDRAEALRDALRNQHIPRARELLSDIYSTEYAVRVRIDLPGSDWELRLDDIMDLVYEALDTETIELPSGLRHVLKSRGLKQHMTVMGKLTRLGWACRDAVSESVATGLHWIAPARKT